MNGSRRRHVRSRPLRRLYLAAAIPLTTMLILSLIMALRQEVVLRREISGYAVSLARDVASCAEDPVKLAAYGLFLADAEASASRKSSVIPGRAALFRRTGELVWASNEGEGLGAFLSTPPEEPIVLDPTDSSDAERSALCLWPSKDPEVVAVVSVSFRNWAEGIFVLHFSFYAIATALFCLLFLGFLKRWFISPLQRLSEEIRSLRWGEDVPRAEVAPRGAFDREADEVVEFRRALTELAHKAVEKEALRRRYVGDLVKTQEEERQRVAREIHDGPIQVVSALVQRVQRASLVDDGRRAAEHLALAEDAALFAVNDLRSICDALSPPWLSLGLVRCLDELAERMSRQLGVSIETSVRLRDEPDPDRLLAIFRICQEGISNAVHHGRADRTTIRVIEGKRDDSIRLYLHDNGGGFDASNTVVIDELRAKGRRGLAGIGERAEFFGGRFVLRSAPGKGTVLSVVLPKPGVSGASDGCASPS